jgi:argininosuccinate lyase
MAKLWKKNTEETLHPAIEEYTVGTSDHLFDIHIFPYDVDASKAHADMLEKINILTPEENTDLQKNLDILMEKWEKGEIEIRKEDEDCHTVIENFLVQECGDAGKKIHTGRSRNDQVLVASRLYAKAKISEIISAIKNLEEKFLEKAKEHEFMPLPGYTHTQQAMLSSGGHYFSAHAESLQNDREFLEKISDQIDQNPLGSAAGYGVAIPLNREMTTQQLGFKKVQKNSLWCQLSRGKLESMIMEGVAQSMMTLGGYAQDMILFTSQEFNFFSAGNAVVTGSSIMPQKRNLDGLEILRGNVSGVIAKQLEIKEIVKNSISGYHRERQLVKRPLIESFDMLLASLEVVGIYLDNLELNQKEIEKKITKEMFLADIANEMVEQEKIPFRDAYVKAFDRLDDYEVDFQKNIRSKVSFGAPGNLGI